MSKPKSREARGYGARHRRMRQIVAIEVAHGVVSCARCGKLIRPDDLFDLDHSDDRSGYLGASHRKCNRSVAGKKGYQAMGDLAADLRTSREW